MTERGKQTVVQVFASAGWGGGEQYVYDLAERLQREGYGVQLVSRESEVIRRKTASLGCPLVQFPLRSRFGLRSILKMKRLIESVEADIVHTHQFKDTFIALFARALSDRKPKVILTRHLVRPAKRKFSLLLPVPEDGPDCLRLRTCQACIPLLFAEDSGAERDGHSQQYSALPSADRRCRSEAAVRYSARYGRRRLCGPSPSGEGGGGAA